MAGRAFNQRTKLSAEVQDVSSGLRNRKILRDHLRPPWRTRFGGAPGLDATIIASKLRSGSTPQHLVEGRDGKTDSRRALRARDGSRRGRRGRAK